MRIKKGDKVKVITGAYKGTIGEVKAVFPKEDRVIVEGVNMVKKHLKPTQANPDGGIVEKEAKIHVSNVMHASVQKSWSGKTATLTLASTASNPLTIGIHLNHGTSIDDLKMEGYTYSVN